MPRSLCMLVCLAVAYSCVAGDPDPEPNSFKSGWDKPEDPDKGCKFRYEHGGLTITLPSKYHDLDPHSGKMNAPRVLRTVAGDFVAEVRVRGQFNPSAPATEPSRIPRTPKVSAGLVLMTSDMPIAILERQVIGDGKREADIYSWVVWKDGMGSGRGGTFVPCGKDGYLRLTRKGDKLSASISADGKKWSELQEFHVKMPAKLKLGVTARTTSAATFSPQFDRFMLRTVKDK